MSALDELASLWRRQAEGFRPTRAAREMEAAVAAEAKQRRRISQWVVGLTMALMLVMAALTFVAVQACDRTAPLGIKALSVLVANSGAGLVLIFVIRRHRCARRHRRRVRDGVQPELHRDLQITVREQRELRGFAVVGGCLLVTELWIVVALSSEASGLNEEARRVLAVSTALNLAGGLLAWWRWRRKLREQRRAQAARVAGCDPTG